MGQPNLRTNFQQKKYFGIRIQNSNTLLWENINHRVSQVNFNWNDIPIDLSNNPTNIIIAVARVNPTLSNNEIKKLADAIQQTINIKPFDCVIALDKQSIVGVGFVVDKQILNSRHVVISIEWVSRYEISDIESTLFNFEKEIQLIKPQVLNHIKSNYNNIYINLFNDLPAPVINPTTSKKIHSRSFNKQYEIKTEELMDHKEDKGGKITIFYGTNRESKKTETDLQIYTSNSGELKYGFCEVQIPKGHIEGELEKPGRFFVFNLPENEKKHIVIKTVKEVDDVSFSDELKKNMVQYSGKYALLFVHGYNTTFEDAAKRTAQLAWDLPFDGFTGFFSWPSSGKIPDYLADEAKTRSSILVFVEFLKHLIESEKLEHIHIIAHSMGSLLVTYALNALHRDPAFTNHLTKIKQLILGAPDIDQEEFRKVILPEFSKIGQRRTIYMSDHDTALKISSFGRRHRLRLGQTGDHIFVAENIDTIEMSNIETQSSHSYIFESRELLYDIYLLLTQGLGPANRRLRAIKKFDLAFWLFPC